MFSPAPRAKLPLSLSTTVPDMLHPGGRFALSDTILPRPPPPRFLSPLLRGPLYSLWERLRSPLLAPTYTVLWRLHRICFHPSVRCMNPSSFSPLTSLHPCFATVRGPWTPPHFTPLAPVSTKRARIRREPVIRLSVPFPVQYSREDIDYLFIAEVQFPPFLVYDRVCSSVLLPLPSVQYFGMPSPFLTVNVSSPDPSVSRTPFSEKTPLFPPLPSLLFYTRRSPWICSTRILPPVRCSPLLESNKQPFLLPSLLLSELDSNCLTDRGSSRPPVFSWFHWFRGAPPSPPPHHALLTPANFPISSPQYRFATCGCEISSPF